MFKYGMFLLFHLFITDYVNTESDNQESDGMEIEIEPLNDGIAPVVSRNSQCQYPCNCPKDNKRCKAGVNLVKDGCDCCYMCARQQGDLCDYKDKCDEAKNLYCDFEMTTGFQSTCRAKDAKPCQIDGKTYKDGEEFKLGCRQLCTCQNGQYACSSMCPQEERPPSTTYCKYPRLIEIENECCREWACQEHSHEFTDNNPRKGPEWSSGEAINRWGLSTAGTSPLHQSDRAPVERPNVKPSKPCNEEHTNWSPCSLTCGMGVSVRVTNQNADCISTQQRRLCLIRPCGLEDQNLTGKECKTTTRAAKEYKLVHDGCTSIEDFSPKYCSTCKKSRCCYPEDTKTLHIEFECIDTEIITKDFMWIKSCVCKPHCE